MKCVTSTPNHKDSMALTIGAWLTWDDQQKLQFCTSHSSVALCTEIPSVAFLNNGIYHWSGWKGEGHNGDLIDKEQNYMHMGTKIEMARKRRVSSTIRCQSAVESPHIMGRGSTWK